MAIKLVDLELSEPIPAISGLEGYDEVWCLVRLHGLPVGSLSLPAAGSQIEPEAIIEQISTDLSWLIMAHLMRDNLLEQAQAGVAQPEPALGMSGRPAGPGVGELSALTDSIYRHRATGQEPPCQTYLRSKATCPVTVGVCTRDGASRLEGCLEALLDLDYPDYEILVVDNAPRDEATRRVVERFQSRDRRIRYQVEPNPGVCWARNRVIREAHGEIIAFADDDARPDRFWLLALVAALQIDSNSIVTGLGYPQTLENDTQVYCEKHWGHNRGYAPQDFSMEALEKRSGRYATNTLGGGFNLAAWRSVLEQVGGFDPALGRGSPAGSASDTDLFYRLLSQGYRMMYEPAAMVRLSHPADFKQLFRHDYAGASGLTAFYTKCFIKEPNRRLSVVKFSLKYLFWVIKLAIEALFSGDRELQQLRLAFVRGALAGPFNYYRSVRLARLLGSGKK